MKAKTLFVVVLIAVLLAGSTYAQHRRHRRPRHRRPRPAPTVTLAPDPTQPVCDETLWQHVYTGDPRKFNKPEDRLRVIERCKVVTGTIFSIKPEKDGDFHIRLSLDPGEEGLLNAKNTSGQMRKLVVEPVCENHVTQRDTLQEGVCTGFSQNLHPLVGQHVVVVGAYVMDMEHGWNEIHPVTSITVTP